MANVTIPGSSAGGVTDITVTTTATSAILQQATQAIATLIATNPTAGNAANFGGGLWPTVLSIGGSVPGGYGPETVNGIGQSNKVVLVNNTDPVVASNADGVGITRETVMAGNGSFTFTDNGACDQIFTGGGNNNITFAANSYNGQFLGDGYNKITVQSTSGVTTIIGTTGSTDTIVGTAGSSGGIYYVETNDSMAIITPNSHNVTVVGTSAGGATSVFGTSFTGSLYVSNGTGYFAGGTNSTNSPAVPNALQSSVGGGTTLIGGGAGDVLTSVGKGDILQAGLGAETLDGSGAAGGSTIFGSAYGSQVIFAGSTVGDVIYTTNSTTAGSYNGTSPSISFVGEFINLHTAPSGALDGNGISGANTIVAGASGSGVQSATINDFISGHDKLVLTASNTGLGVSTVTAASVVGGTSMNVTTVTTGNGSTFTFLNTSALQFGDVTAK